ncbi:hypothetical protein [Lutibacter sp.]|uniref:hypothetical protein n=1 Tax=Lutibacter sp. TaxID=1925666 RepID=UPI0035625B9D
MDFNKIAIITTVSNVSLYKQTIQFFPKEYKIYAIDGSNGLFGLQSFFFFFKKLKNKNFKWLVHIDEDVLFVKPTEIVHLIKQLENENIDVCGIRDGGVLSWRDKNPYLMNPFFCILNIERIFEKFNKLEILKNQYLIPEEFKDDLSKLKYGYDTNSLFEHYYCFFLWLRRNNYKFKFLKVKEAGFLNDLETTEVYSLDNKLLLYHTWYARTYNKNDDHTTRINNVIKLGIFPDKYLFKRVKWLTNYSFTFNKMLWKFINRFINIFK